ncbi:hypothetical protein Tco_1323187 [Tanacetum coccineum]
MEHLAFGIGIWYWHLAFALALTLALALEFGIGIGIGIGISIGLRVCFTDCICVWSSALASALASAYTSALQIADAFGHWHRNSHRLTRLLYRLQMCLVAWLHVCFTDCRCVLVLVLVCMHLFGLLRIETSSSTELSHPAKAKTRGATRK